MVEGPSSHARRGPMHGMHDALALTCHDHLDQSLYYYYFCCCHCYHPPKAACRKSKRASPSARSGGTRAKRPRPLSARRVRLARLCPWPSLHLHCQAPDALQTNPADLGRDKMLRLRKQTLSGQIRRPLWSRGGTRKRSRRTLLTSGTERLCRRCLYSTGRTGSRARRESPGSKACRMRPMGPMGGRCRSTPAHSETPT